MLGLGLFAQSRREELERDRKGNSTGSSVCKVRKTSRRQRGAAELEHENESDMSRSCAFVDARARIHEKQETHFQMSYTRHTKTD